MQDKTLKNLIDQEINRQQNTIDLIASENIASSEVMKITGSLLMNKYSEGYPGGRYYPGNENYDEIENLAIKRAKDIFRLNEDWHANVQPYSGSPANLAIYFALLNTNPLEKNEDSETDILGMALASGGHLTHGHKVSFTGVNYNAIHYGVDSQTGLIDYDELERLAEEHKPKIIVSGATAYPQIINFERIGEIAKKHDAYHLADISHIAGLVAAELHPSPFPHCDVVMATTHKTLRGPRGAIILCKKELATVINKAVFPGLQGGPHNNTIAAMAQAFFEASDPSFKEYQIQVVKNSVTLAEELKKLDFKLVTDGTENHLLLIDLPSSKSKLNGLEAEKKLEEAGIIANRNSIPGDTTPLKPSGIRIGTPTVTSRGMKESEMTQIAEWIHQVIIQEKPTDEIKKEVENLCKKFPLNY